MHRASVDCTVPLRVRVRVRVRVRRVHSMGVAMATMGKLTTMEPALRDKLRISACSRIVTVNLRHLTLQLTACNFFGTKPVQIHSRKWICQA